MVKLTVGIISGFGKVNAQIFGKSCNCQKTGEIVFWGPNPLNCCTFSKRQLERVLQTSNSNADRILLVLWVAWLHGPTCVKFRCKRQVASDGLLPFFSLSGSKYQSRSSGISWATQSSCLLPDMISIVPGGNPVAT